MKYLQQMEDSDSVGHIPINSLLLLLIIAAILFSTFYLIKRYVLPYLSSRSQIKKRRIFIFRLETLLWSLFALFALYTFLLSSFWITTAVVVIIAAVGFNYFRNFFIGLFFRLEQKFIVGDPVRFEEYVGTIEGISSTSIQLKTDDEELVFLNYLNFNKSSLIKRQAKGRLMSQRISFSIEGLDVLQISEDIKRWILECPWAIVNERIIVNISDEKVSVTAYAVDLESLEKVEEFLKKRLSD